MLQGKVPAEEQEVVSLTIPAVLRERIRAYRAARQIASEEQALKDLLERGLEAAANEPTALKVDIGVQEDRE